MVAEVHAMQKQITIVRQKEAMSLVYSTTNFMLTLWPSLHSPPLMLCVARIQHTVVSPIV